MHVNDIEEISETVCSVEHTCECVEIAFQACRTRTDTGSDPPSRSKVRPTRTASVSPGDGGATVSTPSAIFVGRGPHLCAIALFQTVPHAHPHCLIPSRLRFFTQDACARPTPPLSSILPSVDEHGSSEHQRSLWFSTSTMCGGRHRSAVGGDDAPVGS